ncbi:MAG: DUF4221 domain-containing protein [Roseivirga sp.]
MSKTPFIIALLTLFTFACSDNSKVEESTKATYDHNLKGSDSLIQLGVDSVTSNVSDFLTYYDDNKSGTGYLFSINTFMNQLQIFDLNEQKMLRSIPVEMNGERGVGPFKGVHVKDFENIMLFPNQDNRVYIIDTTGTKFEKIEYEQPIGYNNAMISSSFFSASPLYTSDKLIVKTLYQGNYRTISNRELSRKHTAYAIDLNTGKTEMLPHFFPNDYFAGGMKHFEFSAVHSEKGAVYSFFGDHNLYYSSEVEAPLEKVNARSKFLKNQLDHFPADGGGAERGKYFSTSAHYGNLLYDKYRKVYYRFCYPELEITEVQELRANIQFPKKFTVMILDEDLNVIGETMFDKNSELVPKNAFVGKKGLYMSVNHPESKLNNEGQFSFRLMTLEKEGAASGELSYNE